MDAGSDTPGAAQLLSGCSAPPVEFVYFRCIVIGMMLASTRLYLKELRRFM